MAFVEVGRCPKCGNTIGEGHKSSYCDACGEPLPHDLDERLRTKQPAPPNHHTDATVIGRYRDAYCVSAALVSLGNTIKVVGGVFAGIIVLGALSSAGDQYGGGGVALSGILLAAVVGGLFWVCGVLVAAQGQIMSAGLDSAVHSSPFMDDRDRAEVMGLKRPTTGSGSSAERRKGTLGEPER